jgi:hypothetical protein
MTPTVLMIVLSLGSWLALVLMAGRQFIPEFTAGLAGPLVVAVVSWTLVARTYRTHPERVTQLLLSGFMAKALFFGVYVVVMVRGVGLEPVPFALSLGGSFVTLFAIQALSMRRLFTPGAHASA